MGCVLGYFFLMGVLTFYTTYKEKGIFVSVYQKESGSNVTNYWEASSSIKRYDDIYELMLEFKDGKTKKSRKSTSKRSVAQYFDENGTLVMEQLEPEVTKLHNNLLSSRKSK